MQELLSLRPAFQKATGLKLGQKQNYGGIYKIKGHDDKVVKIASPYGDQLSRMMTILEYLKKRNDPSVVKIHMFGKLEVKDSYSNIGQTYYYYVMDKLLPLSRKMKGNLFYGLVDGYHGDIVSGLPRSFKTFLKRANQLKYKYSDFHSGNVMRAKNGSLKFIDLESFYY